MRPQETLTVNLGARSYEILVGEGLLAQTAEHMSGLLREDRVFVITDSNVAALHLPALERNMEQAGITVHRYVLPPGEESKSFAALEALVDWLLEARIERRSLLLALGGGVIGDLAGFAAAVVLRGVDYVQLPTTLLAQVDSSVGGKTAISTARGKNLVGSFHQPRLVLADTGTLTTLPRRELLAGYAEVVKYGLLGDADFFAWLQAHGMRLIEGDGELRQQAVATSCTTKAAVVAADEREAGQRALLNLGHTFGHALEAETGFSSALLHGEAVSVGLVWAFELSARLGLLPAEDVARVRHHLAAVGLPTGVESLPPRAWSAQALIDHMRRDKKVAGGRIVLVLARGIGRAFVTDAVGFADLEAFLNDEIAE